MNIYTLTMENCNTVILKRIPACWYFSVAVLFRTITTHHLWRKERNLKSHIKMASKLNIPLLTLQSGGYFHVI